MCSMYKGLYSLTEQNKNPIFMHIKTSTFITFVFLIKKYLIIKYKHNLLTQWLYNGTNATISNNTITH